MTQPPDLQQTTLTRSQLRAVLEEILKGDPAAQTRTRDNPTDQPLRDHLASGHAGHMQIRYLHDGVAWIDTIMPIDAETVKLIRTQAPQSSSHGQVV